MADESMEIEVSDPNYGYVVPASPVSLENHEWNIERTLSHSSTRLSSSTCGVKCSYRSPRCLLDATMARST